MVAIGMQYSPAARAGEAPGAPDALRSDGGPLARPLLRRPVALALVSDSDSPDEGERWLFVANRRSGTITTIDTKSNAAVAETAIGKQLSDLEAMPDGRHLLATDEPAHELIVCSHSGPAVAVAARLAVSPYPVSVAVSPDGRRACVASLWSRRLTLVDLSPLAASDNATDPGAPELRTLAAVPLPFAPREQVFLRGGRTLIVADAFGGKLAVVDAARGQIDAVRELPAHNIRGLAVDEREQKLLVSHQILSGLAQTTHNDVHWGILLVNVLRWLELEKVLDPSAAVLEGSHVHPAGDSNGAGGDPAGVALARDGTALVALSGVNQVAVGRETDYALRQVASGRRPTAVAIGRDARRAYVANTFGDSIGIIDLESGEGATTSAAEISLGAPAELSLADEGELLFYDARLSLDGWYSCHSCHTDGHSNGQRVDNLSDGSFGAAKRVLSLLGSGDTGPWAWNGGVPQIESQVRKSIVSTMLGEAPPERQVQALTAYLRSLAPPPALGPLIGDDADAATRGGRVFQQQGCARCHAGPAYTSAETYDVGLEDSQGNRRFNPPSLRGVSQGGPYFHDGRAATLDEVLERYQHGLESKLSADELHDLLAYLRSL